MLASLDDLAAIGALPGDIASDAPVAVRAARLLELASAQALAYMRIDDEADLADWSAVKLTSLAAIVCEAAGARLNVTAAPSTDPFASVEGLSSALLNRRHMRMIDKLIGRAGRGTRSVPVERDSDSSFLTQSNFGRYDPYSKTDL